MASTRTIKFTFRCHFEKTIGQLHFFSDATFLWQADGGSRVDQPQGSLSDVDSRKLSKAQPGKPVYLLVQMKSKVSYTFQFDTVETRQEVYDMLSPGARSAAPSPVVMTSSNDYHDTPMRVVNNSNNHSNNNNNNNGNNRPMKQFKFDLGVMESFSGNGNEPSEDDKRAREVILKKDKNLEALYNKLVKEKLLSEEDFWSGKEARVEEERMAAKLRQGLKPESLVDPHQLRGSAVLSGPATQEVEMTMTKEMMQRVFLEHPEVLQKYKDNVPTMLSEKEFWTAYMHCKYVLGAKRNIDFRDLKAMSTMNASATAATMKRNQRTKEQEMMAEKLFGSVDDYRLQYRDALKQEFSQRIRVIDQEVDLRKTLDDSIGYSIIPGLQTSGYGIVQRDPSDGLIAKSESEFARSLREKAKIVDKDTAKQITKAVKDDPLLTQINERATLALHATVHIASQQQDERRSQELRRQRLAEDFQQELKLDGDLLPDAKPNVFPLVLPTTTTTASTASNEDAEPASSGGKFRPILSHHSQYVFDPIRSLPSKAYHYLPSQVHEEEAALLRLDPQLQGSTVPADIREGFLLAMAAVDEYCRHFWQASGDAEFKKRCAIVKKMKELEKQMNGDLRQVMRLKQAETTQLLKVPLSQLGRCYEEHSVKCDVSH